MKPSAYLEPTDGARAELVRLAQAIYRVHSVAKASKENNLDTMEVLKKLNISLKDRQWPEFARPQMFIAASRNADRRVTGEIQKVLDQFVDRMEVVYWRDISKSGNISTQIIEEISKSKFGLCYFSEPATSGDQKCKPGDQKYKYRDNPNVLFEAGMMQALTNSPNAHPTGWIPVREKSSPTTLFDFAGDRILFVDRLEKDDAFNDDAFQAALEDRVISLLK